MSGSIIAYAAAGVLGLSLLGWRFKQDPKTYGSAGWLKPWTAMRARLFKRKGILVGDWTGLLPVYYEDTHAISFGPSGSGKSSLALALMDRGAELIGDDGAAVVCFLRHLG